MSRAPAEQGSSRGGRLRRPACLVASAFLAGALLAACSSVTVYRLTDATYPRRGVPSDIRLFVNKVQRPHKEIAFIDSESMPEETEEARREQLEQIQAKAWELGADAVHDIRPLGERVQGVVVDHRVPFTAFKQGRYKLYFIRGTAIVYTNEATPPTGATPTPTPYWAPEEEPQPPESPTTTELAPPPED